MQQKLKIASRRSPLALIQTNMAGQHLAGSASGYEVIEKVTTGDKQQGWSLEKKGGKGLFTKELEEAIVSGEVDIAVHSAKDLPTELPNNLVIAGYLPRETPNDVLILSESVKLPHKIATASPRRRAQMRKMYPHAEFGEIRGNVATRLHKMADGYADATVMAAAGLKRLNIDNYHGLKFIPLTIEHMVPAVGQGAIAIECHIDRVSEFRPLLDAFTFQAVSIERIFLTMLGGGCQTAFAGHFIDDYLHIFHENIGYKKHLLKETTDMRSITEQIADIVRSIGILQQCNINNFHKSC